MRAYERKMLFSLLIITLVVLAASIFSVVKHSYIGKHGAASRAQVAQPQE